MVKTNSKECRYKVQNYPIYKILRHKKELFEKYLIYKSQLKKMRNFQLIFIIIAAFMYYVASKYFYLQFKKIY